MFPWVPIRTEAELRPPVASGSVKTLSLLQPPAPVLGVTRECVAVFNPINHGSVVYEFAATPPPVPPQQEAPGMSGFAYKGSGFGNDKASRPPHMSSSVDSVVFSRDIDGSGSVRDNLKDVGGANGIYTRRVLHDDGVVRSAAAVQALNERDSHLSEQELPPIARGVREHPFSAAARPAGAYGGRIQQRALPQLLSRKDPSLAIEMDRKLHQSHAFSALEVPSGMRGVAMQQPMVTHQSLIHHGVVRGRTQPYSVAHRAW